ncbi:TM2 domain-containing protein [Campylobacter coli]|uniref:TM2 domain-containing protein n=1 Tax=Campylobacter coli TaxID=195 RepID=UPI000AC17EB4|nr:TM2 domain-containing protein [Campylobacter coli]HEB7543484.1 TM2 domain-containing protein [Campylobacter coli]HEB7547868.1 TM2 domain-containing protein [Campylobacter coli]HEB7554583.1 TM2 domain-containing protein [Campylobacter coli]HEB7556186.1 TM2 domain-containing protein [Campylobacter coli]HED6588149.1 TM2 domain-containing protein [Campylobacter coli]
MKQDKTILLIFKDKIPEERLFILEEELKKSRKDLSALYAISLKNPLVGLVLSITVGLFGVDRFYKGDILLACIKLAFFIIPLFATFAILIALLNDNHSIFIDYFAIFALMFVVASIWKLVDIYLVFVGIKKDNFHKILNFFS